MLSIIWPVAIVRKPSFVGRLGRVLHWVLTIFGLFIALMAFQWMYSSMQVDLLAPPPDGRASQAEVAAWLWRQGSKNAVWAISILLLGRATRYIFSGE